MVSPPFNEMPHCGEISLVQPALWTKSCYHIKLVPYQSCPVAGEFQTGAFGEFTTGVDKGILPKVRREIENYYRLRDLTGRWVELEIEWATLRRDEGKSNRRDRGKEQRHTR